MVALTVQRHDAEAWSTLPPTIVTVSGGYIVVSTTIDAKRRYADTYVYISGQTPGVNLIYHQPVPTTFTSDPGWSCPCVAQIAYRASSGTFKILTAPSEPFTPSQ